MINWLCSDKETRKTAAAVLIEKPGWIICAIHTLLGDSEGLLFSLRETRLHLIRCGKIEVHCIDEVMLNIINSIADLLKFLCGHAETSAYPQIPRNDTECAFLDRIVSLPKLSMIKRFVGRTPCRQNYTNGTSVSRQAEFIQKSSLDYEGIQTCTCTCTA